MSRGGVRAPQEGTDGRVRAMRYLCALVGATLCTGAAWAGPPDPARVEAAGIDAATAVRLDGSLDEDAWSRAEPIRDFLQREPQEGAAPSHATEVRVLYDETHLYVAVLALDSEPSRIVGIRTRRDDTSPSDWIRVLVDSYHDRRTAYEFAVNPAGVKQDRYWFGDGNSDRSWDAVWDVAVSRDERGWRAEFRIPLSQLRFEPGAGDTFGFAVVREVGRLNEVSTWPLVAKSRPGYVSQFGELVGLKLTRAGRRLEVVPYTVAQAKTQPTEAGNPFLSSPDPGGTVGADIKYAITPGLTLTATVNPDFGQVEADPAVVNLSSFETFYEERRPFFVEGSAALRFDLDCNDGQCTGLFYSRRIGRFPQASLDDVPDEAFVSTPTQTTILGAAKLTGRIGAFSVGAMNAVTGKERAQVALLSARSSPTIEPLTSYSVAQARREWRNQSSLGFMVTSTDRALDAGTRFLAGHAVTGGTSWDWRLKDPRYALTGYWAGSTVHGSAESIERLQTSAVHRFDRPDAGHVDLDLTRRSLNGHAGMLGLNKLGGERVRFSLIGNYKSPGFEVNDVGYQRRADDVSQSSWVQFRWDKATSRYRSFRFNLNQWSGWNFDGDSRYKGANVNAHIVFPSNWGAGGGISLESRGIDDRSARGGPAFVSKRGGNVWYYVETDGRRALSGRWMGFYWRDESASSTYGFDPNITWRPTSFVSLSGGVSFNRNDEDTQWVENVERDTGTDYVFGRIRQTTVGLTARANYTLAPNLTVQAYLAPFVSAGEYSAFKSLVRPRVQPIGAQFASFAYEGSPDFNYRSFRMTNVLRWEYRPGSALYVVWQQGREEVLEHGRFRFSDDMGSLFGLPGTNVFLVKASYWFNF